MVRAQFAINMACNVHYVDFEGLVDGRSVRNIIKNMQPRRARGLSHCSDTWPTCSGRTHRGMV